MVDNQVDNTNCYINSLRLTLQQQGLRNPSHLPKPPPFWHACIYTLIHGYKCILNTYTAASTVANFIYIYYIYIYIYIYNIQKLSSLLVSQARPLFPIFILWGREKRVW